MQSRETKPSLCLQAPAKSVEKEQPGRNEVHAVDRSDVPFAEAALNLAGDL
jgi:hypothetical protein